MSKAPLPSYLRTHRKHSALTHEEVSSLIGAKSSTTVSRHEASSRAPILRIAFAYEILYGTPASALLPQEYEEARSLIESQAISLLGRLTREGNPATQEKRRFLERLIQRVRM